MPTPKNLSYDVFISYARSDKIASESVARFLKDSGLRVWLDTWNLVPGMPWVQTLEDAIGNSAAVAVLIGASGLGESQDQELKSILENRSGVRPG